MHPTVLRFMRRRGAGARPAPAVTGGEVAAGPEEPAPRGRTPPRARRRRGGSRMTSSESHDADCATSLDAVRARARPQHVVFELATAAEAADSARPRASPPRRGQAVMRLLFVDDEPR